MSKNIKNIGKELLGKSLNSFHRKTGLTQLEKNNEMQDGILNGILSQVDDAYIEKTEQSNVIHLEGSGDGVVVLDGIEGNTMVNLATVKTITLSNVGSKLISNIPRKSNTVYTLVFDVTSNTATSESDNGIYLWTTSSATVSSSVSANVLKGRCVYVMTSTTDVSNWSMGCRNTLSGIITLDNIMILEGDWRDKEIPVYFEGLQSSFEEQVEDDKYKVEILMKNKNLIPIEYKKYENYTYHSTYKAIKLDKLNPNETYRLSVKTKNGNLKNGEYICISPTINPNHASSLGLSYFMFVENGIPRSSMIFSPQNNGEYYLSFWHNDGITKETFNNMMNEIEYIQLEKVNSSNKWEQPKQNKIKLLINEPLRATDTVKDKICIKDNRLVVERNCGEVIFNGEENWQDTWQNLEQDTNIYFHLTYSDFGNYAKYPVRTESIRIVSDYFNNAYCGSSIWGKNTDEKVAIHSSVDNYYFQVSMLKSNLSSLDKQGFKNFIKSRNGLKFVYKLAEPYYEEVLNEYGEPIILEGYENGTLYIDSTIVPTTTVRYTPKMESLNTLKEVNNNNVMLTNDINDMIVPYMMEVDLMIMEKEVALMSQKNIRKIGAEDMTSMQKRTYDMLARLIKGKTLNEQECKTRVTVYLNAGKITDEQAKELNFLIDEIYA